MQFILSLIFVFCFSCIALAQDIVLDYDFSNRVKIKIGFNDLNCDGVYDALLTTWNGKAMLFVSDDGRLPFKDENTDWSKYFNKAFNIDVFPFNTWNEIRSNWGNYTIFIDKDNCRRFDSHGDWYYKCIDLNGDARPEAEYFCPFPGEMVWDNPHSSKFHINFNGEPNMSFLNWKTLFYENEQIYGDGYKYVMNVHGSGMFMNSYRKGTFTSWENPIAWYDFNNNGITDMVMRAADLYAEKEAHKGVIGEAEFAFELNKDTGKHRYHSLDLQMTYYDNIAKGYNYLEDIDRIPKIEGMQDTQYLSERLKDTRLQIYRAHVPYMDGYKLLTDHDKWKGVFLLFDEDNDDVRWEEMFARYEGAGEFGYSDKIGDRFENDTDFLGRGKLYIGRFDGRIHLYHAEQAVWDVDYFGLYKGSMDRTPGLEGPQPPVGLSHLRVRYSDTNKNGFIDKIEYMTVSYTGNQNDQAGEHIYKTINILDYADAEMPEPDVNILFDPRVDSKITNWNIAKWNGKPLTPGDFEGTSIKDGYNKMFDLYTNVLEDMWRSGERLYEISKKYKLNKSEGLDKGIKTLYTLEELAGLKAYSIPEGYSRHLTGKTRREKYNNGFWLKEKVFADILENSGLDKFTLEKYYYTGRTDQLCDYIDKNIKQ